MTGRGHESKGASAKKKKVQVRVRPVSLEMGDEWAPIQWLRSRKEGGWGFESRTQSMK